MADPNTQAPLTVGFDLDMTLIDSRPGIKYTYDLVAEEFGVPIDSELVISRLGPPVEREMAHWFPPERVQEVSDRYRQLYAVHGVDGCDPLPGAVESLAAVRELGGRALVVTGKHTPNAVLCLKSAGMADAVSEVFGDVFAEGKGEILITEGAAVYVGDHLGDLVAARTAGAVGVGVATGPYTAAELTAEGADVSLPDLTGFPAWLAGYAGRASG
ncbi:HAD family hydrolase [Phaeacidiphilus oryzae]|uniref:HAD family hydrolase n=1 Tax=Phaeacidiphilus oryzae TaxID=348818 RepID=UPI00056A5AE1|nr:HAD hydrolase-like protein [Phaeacidiphilus oryzae]